jgi:hypothetical protein
MDKGLLLELAGFLTILLLGLMGFMCVLKVGKLLDVL